MIRANRPDALSKIGVSIANDSQRKRDDNKNNICAFQGGVGSGAGRKIVQNVFFHGKRHDNEILKVQILLSRNYVVMAQAPRFARIDSRESLRANRPCH